MRHRPRIQNFIAASVALVAVSGCNESQLDQLPATSSEIHYQGGDPPPVDVLFVVDNSGSMEQEQAKLAANFETFIQYFLNLDLDFQLAIVTTDTENPNESGKFQGTPAILKPTTTNLAGAFAANANVGTAGSGVERGLEAARMALSEPNLTGANAGFLREDALLAIIIVSDEEDGGSEDDAPAQDPVSAYVDHFLSLKGGDPARVNFSAIAGDIPNGCTSVDAEAAAAVRYAEAVNALSGYFGSICATDFGPILDQLGATISGLATGFPTQYQPVVESITVKVDGVLIPNDPLTGWTWNSTIGGVVFAPPAIPPLCSVVEISYQVADYGGPITDGNNEAAPEQCPIPVVPGSNELNGGAFACSLSGFESMSDAGVVRLLALGFFAAAATFVLRRRSAL